MAQHTNSNPKTGYTETATGTSYLTEGRNTEEQAERRVYAPYQVVNIILRRTELLGKVHNCTVPVLEGVLAATLEVVNEELSAIRPQDVDRNLKLPGTE